MQKITYLLGAGASANALPLIKGSIDNNVAALPQQLLSFVNDQTTALTQTNKGWGKNNIETLLSIANKCIEFGTPDLYAKYLLEIGDEINYKYLKHLLSIFFKYKQEKENRFDLRALTFLTTIASNQKIPENIKIISWNYDSQIEIAARKMKPINSQGYSMIKGFTCWPNSRDGFDTGENPFLLHLNGIAGVNYSERNFYEEFESCFSFADVEKNESLLSFAWEDEENAPKKIFNEQKLKVALEMATNTDILVVIGYSFPFFNRKVDQQIFYSMHTTLKKIYFQDPFNNGEQLKSQFNLGPQANASIIHIKSVENYHIPFEL